MNNFSFAFSFLFIWLLPLTATANDFVCNPWKIARIGDEAPISSDEAFAVSFKHNTLVIGGLEYLMLIQSDTDKKGAASAMVYHYDLGWPYTIFVGAPKMEAINLELLSDYEEIYLTRVDGPGDDIEDLGIAHTKCKQL